MTRPRREQIAIEDTPYYHVTSRCVRRSFLCGQDPTTGKSYEHRRQWIEDRIRILSSIFAVEVCAYAVMSNHLHIVIKLCPEQVETLSDEQVVQHWASLFKGPLLIQKWRGGHPLHAAERETVSDIIALYRSRLASLSWFMKCLNEPIARQANAEDGCAGHFWESRYKSQALRSEEALLSCMAYVDLNPVRAGMAATPEDSEHTSIKERVAPQFDLERAVESQIELQALIAFSLPIKPLACFDGNVTSKPQCGILFSLTDYLELIDFTGRCLRPDKRGAIPGHLPPILQRLNIDCDTWLTNATQFEQNYNRKFSRRHRNST